MTVSLHRRGFLAGNLLARTLARLDDGEVNPGEVVPLGTLGVVAVFRDHLRIRLAGEAAQLVLWFRRDLANLWTSRFEGDCEPELFSGLLEGMHACGLPPRVTAGF